MQASEFPSKRTQALHHVSRAQTALESVRSIDGRFAANLSLALTRTYQTLLTAEGDALPSSVAETVRGDIQRAVDGLGITPQEGELARHMSTLRRHVYELIRLAV